MCEYCNKNIIVCNGAFEALLNLRPKDQPLNNIDTVTIPKQQYEDMQKKCKQYDNQHYLRHAKT